MSLIRNESSSSSNASRWPAPGEVNGIAIVASKADGSRAIETSMPQKYLGNVALGIIALYFAVGATVANAHKWGS